MARNQKASVHEGSNASVISEDATKLIARHGKVSTGSAQYSLYVVRSFDKKYLKKIFEDLPSDVASLRLHAMTLMKACRICNTITSNLSYLLLYLGSSKLPCTRGLQSKDFINIRVGSSQASACEALHALQAVRATKMEQLCKLLDDLPSDLISLRLRVGDLVRAYRLCKKLAGHLLFLRYHIKLKRLPKVATRSPYEFRTGQRAAKLGRLKACARAMPSGTSKKEGSWSSFKHG